MTWRLAAVSSALTLVILVVFAVVVGRLATERIRDDFHEELRRAAGQVAFEIQVSARPGPAPSLSGPDIEELAIGDQAAVRVVTATGQVIAESVNAPDLGPPRGGIQKVDRFNVATAPVATSRVGTPALYVQYARSRDEVENTVGWVWIFLACGVVVGTLLAALAGLVVARRAMRPIALLTTAAREIGSTRDPSRRIPSPPTEDEVGELARTLDGMLRALDETRNETQQAMQRQREFVADASHELRTPLTSILANLELLDASLRSVGSGDDHAAVTSALRSSKRMSRLVSDLLLLARADTGRTGGRGQCDLAAIAAGAVSEVGPVAPAHSIAFEGDGPVLVEGNPDELHRMILNLVENATRHTPEGTEVTVRVGTDGDDAIAEVRDDGPGLPPGVEEQVFERFVRGAVPADRAGRSGTGLGLAIVKAVALSHGGDVAASSGHKGAQFTVRLPVAGRSQSDATTGQPAHL